MYNKNVFSSELCFFSFNDILNINLFLKRIAIDGKIENIQDIFVVPFGVIDVSEFQRTTATIEFVTPSITTPVNFHYDTLPRDMTNFDSAWSEDIEINKPLTFSDFVPKNNKVKCYPYNYIYLSNGNGENNILKIEEFSGNKMTFKNLFAIAIGGSRKISSYKL